MAVAALVAAADAAAVEVEITGLPEDLERNVRAFLSITELTDEAREEAEAAEAERDDAGSEDEAGPDDEPEEDVGEARIRRLHAAANGEIAAALQPFGYYQPSIDASLTQSDGEWVARYAIDPGPPTLLAEVEIEVVGEGADTPPVRAARAAVRLRPGDVLNHARYEAAKQALFDAAYGAGYIDAAYRRSELLVRRSDREADVHLVLDTGPRYYFGTVSVEQDILHESFVKRFVPIQYGEPFDTDRLVQLQIMLNDSGYFNDVVVDVERERAEDRHIPIVVHTTPRPTQEYTVGFGYGTDTGPRVSLGVELRRINPRGHRFNADLRLSSIEQAVAAEYRIPRGRDLATDFLALRGSLGNQEIGGWDTRQMSVGAVWHGAWRRMQRRTYLTVLREEFETDAVDAVSEDTVFAGVQLTKKTADDPLFPRRGYSWSVDVRAGGEALGASTSFARVHASGNVVRSLGERVRALLRAEYGAIRADDFDKLPPSQRFYAGGDGSVRGYGYQELGPTDENGASIGGRYAFVASAELEFLVVGNYGVALFFDAGNAANDPWPDLERGVGIGARWRSPVGVVGIDLAHPLDDPDTDFRLHLSVGSDL